MKTNKLTHDFQEKWNGKNIYDRNMLLRIGKNVQLHKEVNNVLSSSAACLNVFGALNKNPHELCEFLNQFNLDLQEIIKFPSGSEIGGELYDDQGYIIFEWIGPKKSTINEKGGKRGQNRTSIDAYVIGKIYNKITQILIEWKFTESYNSSQQLQKFSGIAGNERLRRYSSVLAKLRKKHNFPLKMDRENSWGLYDLGYEPFYQLLRMTLLAKTTTPLKITEEIEIKDYRILHLSHSQNTKLNIVTGKQLKYCPGIRHLKDNPLHEIWSNFILEEKESSKFKFGFWDGHLNKVTDIDSNTYLNERYG